MNNYKKEQMKKETLSEIGRFVLLEDGKEYYMFSKEVVEEKIQNARKRLKEFEWFEGTDEPWEKTLERFEKFKNKVFKEEFGDKLV